MSNDETTETTFVETVVKIIGPQIVADFIKQTWNNLSDDERESMAKEVNKLLVKSINPDSYELRHVVENEVRQTTSKIAKELTVLHYAKILEHAHSIYEKTMIGAIERACNDAIKETLKAVNQRLTKELDNIIWDRK